MKSIYVPMNDETGYVTGQNGKLQTRRIKATLKKAFPNAVITFNAGHYYCSAFIEFSSDNIIYFMTCDYRSLPNQYLIRTAKYEQDYSGGVNINCKGFDTIVNEITKLYKNVEFKNQLAKEC